MGDTTPESSGPPPQVIQQDNPAFSFVVPTEFIELPSQGKFYDEDHPLHNEESIEIRHMTAKEEDLLTSRTLLKKGIAIERLLKNIIVNRNIDPDSLLVGDRNAIIIAVRTSGYGNIYTTQITCPACTTSQDYSFDLNEASVYDGENRGELDIIDNQDGTYTVELLNIEVTATFRLLTGYDEKKLVGSNKKARANMSEKAVTTQLRNMLVGVNGSDDSKTLDALIENMPSLDSRRLRHAYKLAAPNIDLTQDFICQECDHEQEMEVPLTADFFWPDR
jgi:hypothetical protein|tara:strand:- start:2253 stop:3083 length:831 start_codon:yes stop_codon:yes gene_type:complete